MRILKSYYIPVLIRPVLICITLCAFWIISCENQNEEDLFGTSCDTISVSYSNDIEPLIAGKCLHCHYTGGIAPFSLQTYDDVLIRVNTGQLEAAVNHYPGSPRMPQDGPKLPDCELANINIWIREGAANN